MFTINGEVIETVWPSECPCCGKRLRDMEPKECPHCGVSFGSPEDEGCGPCLTGVHFPTHVGEMRVYAIRDCEHIINEIMPVFVGRDLEADHAYITAINDEGDCVSISIPLKNLEKVYNELIGIRWDAEDEKEVVGRCRSIRPRWSFPRPMPLQGRRRLPSKPLWRR